MLPNGTFDAVGSPTSRLWCPTSEETFETREEPFEEEASQTFCAPVLSVSSSLSSTSGQVKITCRAPQGSILSLISEEVTFTAEPSVHESRSGKHISHLSYTIKLSSRTSGGQPAKKGSGVFSSNRPGVPDGAGRSSPRCHVSDGLLRPLRSGGGSQATC